MQPWNLCSKNVRSSRKGPEKSHFSQNCYVFMEILFRFFIFFPEFLQAFIEIMFRKNPVLFIFFKIEILETFRYTTFFRWKNLKLMIL